MFKPVCVRVRVRVHVWILHPALSGGGEASYNEPPPPLC